jgi:hypothetical protein
VVTLEGSNEATEGEESTLQCLVAQVDIILLLGGTISYSWTGGNRSSELGSSKVYTFTPQAGDHGATYHCRATVNSTTLNPPIITGGSAVIDVLGKTGRAGRRGSRPPNWTAGGTPPLTKLNPHNHYIQALLTLGYMQRNNNLWHKILQLWIKSARVASLIINVLEVRPPNC